MYEHFFKQKHRKYFETIILLIERLYFQFRCAKIMYLSESDRTEPIEEQIIQYIVSVLSIISIWQRSATRPMIYNLLHQLTTFLCR